MHDINKVFQEKPGVWAPTYREKETIYRNIIKHPILYLMVIPGLLFFIMIRIVPIIGSVIAWKDYSIFDRSIWSSPWVGWKHFYEMFNYYDFIRIFSNTFFIGLYKIIFGFPVPIILALLINEVHYMFFKRSLQTLLYLPHFLSFVIVSQIVIDILSPTSGIVNIFLRDILHVKPIFFMAKENFFQPIVVISGIWKESGFQSIIYLAALTTIDPQLYEAAAIDGANRWQQTWKITLPSLIPTVTVLLLLNIGRFLEIGFDQVYTLLNPLVWNKGDIFDTYIYRVGLLEGKYSLTTAIGLFKSVISFILLMGCNHIAKKLTGKGFFQNEGTGKT